ncbi:hypothetical protein AKJ16_DCAP06794 [Drosera capensis]
MTPAILFMMESASAIASYDKELIESNEGISISQSSSSSNPAADVEEKDYGESDTTKIVRREGLKKIYLSVKKVRDSVKFVKSSQTRKKYWEDYSMILSVAMVLDPYYKLEVVEFCYEKMHDGNRLLISQAIERVRLALKRLYEEYKSMPKEKWSYEDFDPSEEDPFASWTKRKNQHIG